MRDPPKLKPPWDVDPAQVLAKLVQHSKTNPIVHAVFCACKNTGAKMGPEYEFLDLVGVMAWMVDELVDQAEHMTKRCEDLVKSRPLPYIIPVEEAHVPSLFRDSSRSGNRINPCSEVPDDED